jgi:hypothetical protein
MVPAAGDLQNQLVDISALACAGAAHVHAQATVHVYELPMTAAQRDRPPERVRRAVGRVLDSQGAASDVQAVAAVPIHQLVITRGGDVLPYLALQLHMG